MYNTAAYTKFSVGTLMIGYSVRRIAIVVLVRCPEIRSSIAMCCLLGVMACDTITHIAAASRPQECESGFGLQQVWAWFTYSCPTRSSRWLRGSQVRRSWMEPWNPDQVYGCRRWSAKGAALYVEGRNSSAHWSKSMITFCKQLKNSVAWVRERTIPTKRPQLVGEVSANFLRIDGATRSAWRIPTAVFSAFQTGAVFYLKYLLNFTLEAEWTPFQTHYFSENLAGPGIESGPLDL
jgi:hypothetical protein